MKIIKFHPSSQEQYNKWGATDIKIFNRIRELIKNIQEYPFKGIGKPEPLKHKHKGSWSRRINREHRLIYRVTPDAIHIISCKGHYD